MYFRRTLLSPSFMLALGYTRLCLLKLTLTHSHTHTCTDIVPVGSHFHFPEVETEQHFLERPLLAVMGE